MSKYAPHHKSATQSRPTSSTVCQKCLGTGHFTAKCTNPRAYVSRPSRTQQLENPQLLSKLAVATKPSVEVPEEFKKKTGTADKILSEREKARNEQDKGKGKRTRSNASSDSDSSSSGSDSSDSGSDSDSSSSSGSSRSRKRRRPRSMTPPRRKRSTSR
ncbi:hypothetical protein CYLTODRAFT_373354 [Cylindrobasidium torrendii FP15055 ss-10]|uniref:Zinc knuckle-domain-containing protein n=1 Tax=Cylindrobasidium torrendii FP15055 ss-10 TaxID=1314674 RepID=A0A0D7BHI6_9AGAR|nr:hypothetical protein CYLTODRAFT_373354 [Cylindrobasidium torrendii FP15055 ss-10]